jgi:two-component system, cell cycle sensor histidine kinase and response regulator CckA
MIDNPVLRDGVCRPKPSQFRDAVAAAPIGIACVSCDTGVYVFVNETFARMVGRCEQEILRSDPYEMLLISTHADDLPRTRLSMERLARGELDRDQYEKRLVPKHGEARWVAVDALAKRDANGRLAFVTLYFTDIHERRTADAKRARLEDQLRHAQKLEALGRLAGGVAHDFNNRLVVIMGYAQLLKERLPLASPLGTHADRVLESAMRAAELTQQLLAYGRRQVCESRVFDLSTTVDNMRRMLARLIGDGIELSTHFAASAPNVRGSAGQIEQVVINLAINARDAMPEGGRLSLETKNVTLVADQCEALPAGEYVALVVSDTGSGIPKDVLPHIFEPFFTTKEVGRGTGLGLATVEGIVRQSGGAIHVDSCEGRGTTFTILLPRATAAPNPRELCSPTLVSGATGFGTVLVCDDDDEVRELIGNVLALRGYVVLRARNAQAALALAAEQRAPIDLLVTDLVTPKLGGLELAAELRSRQPRLSVLYIAGHAARTAVIADQLEPNTQFLQKPFMPSELTRTVCSILERQ